LLRAASALLFVSAVFLHAAARADAEARVVPQTTHKLDANYCLAVSRGNAVFDTAKCPAFIVDQLPEADRWCREMQGALQAGDDPAVDTLDIDGDGGDEYLFVFDGTFVCPGSYSLFGCGSSMCPQVMYRRDAGNQWRELGDFPAGARFAAVARADDPRHPDLRIHCEDENFCAPALYRWQAQAASPHYREIERTLRGFTVTMLQEGKLLVIAHKVPIYAAPRAGAAVLYESDSGAYFAVFGEIANTDFVAAAPCHACEPGFVRRADVGM
jgi:hypothetical protein